MICILFNDKIKEEMMSGHMACMGQNKTAYIILVGNLYGGDHVEDFGFCERIILK
jgi:hypothetical protein